MLSTPSGLEMALKGFIAKDLQALHFIEDISWEFSDRALYSLLTP